jgi:hypothetical protein
MVRDRRVIFTSEKEVYLKMRSGGSKEKGSSFERLICEKLSLWVSKGESKSLFWRSSMSGGRATIQLAKGIKNLTQAGDISAIDLAGHLLLKHFVIECKHYKSLNIETSIIKRHGVLYQFWRQLRRDCKALGKQPMLIARQNNFPILLVTSTIGGSLCNIGTPILILPQWIAEVYLFEELIQLPCVF